MSTIHNIDLKIIHFINTKLRSKYLDYLNIIVTYLGSDIFAVGLLLALAFLPQQTFRPFGISTSLSLVLTTLTVQILKRTIKRRRPFELMENLSSIKVGIDPYSFPSGHTASAFSIAMAFSLLTINPWFSVIYFLIATMVGFSRLYLAVHFPSDVVVGAIIGIVCSLLIYILVFLEVFMYQNIEAAIFDLDGTLVDSMWVWSKIDIDFIDKRDLKIEPENLMKEIAHFSFHETAQYFKNKFNMPESVDDIKAEWNTAAAVEYSKNVHLKEGVLELLNILKKNNIKIALATSNSHELLNVALKANGILEYFDALVTTDDSGAKSKIEPDVYLYAAKKLGVNPENCVVFEDVPSAMIGAKKAGMQVVGVKDKYTIIEASRKQEICNHFIENFNEIHHLFIKAE